MLSNYQNWHLPVAGGGLNLDGDFRHILSTILVSIVFQVRILACQPVVNDVGHENLNMTSELMAVGWLRNR
jgi:hypothetical protein